MIGKIEIIASIITYFSNGSLFGEEEEEESKQILRLGNFEPIGDAASLFRYVIYK